MRTRVEFDIERLAVDMAARGWLAPDLARAAGLAAWSVRRVLRGDRMNPRTWDRIARAMGYSAKRYVRVKKGDRHG